MLIEERTGGDDLATFVDAARRRLGYLGVRSGISRQLGHVLVAIGVGAATRPFVWPGAGTLESSVVHASLLGVASACAALTVIVVRAWRDRPDRLETARRIDAELGLAEVVASGFAFERDRRGDEMALFALERARRAIEDVDIHRRLVPVAASRSKRGTRWLVSGAAVVVVGVALGVVDRNAVDRVLHPPTGGEVAAAAALKQAAELVANAPQPLDPTQKAATEEMVDAARRASEAAARGDRRRAIEALEDMRRATRAFEAAQREQARSLRSLRDELEGRESRPGAGDDTSSRRAATASEALAKLKKDLDMAAGKEALQKMVERLDRAESSAKTASGAAWARAAAALKEAREAAAGGDTEAAKRAVERAEREIAGLEKSNSEASAAGQISRIADEGSQLGRSMHAAMTRNPAAAGGGDRKSEPAPGEGSDGRQGSKHASSGKGEPSGAPGGGPGHSERTGGPEQRRMNVDGNLQARTNVRAGERAVSAIQGMGRGDDPHGYAEIFPSYDTVVEDGLREDVVPAARRPAVRRYFSSIRPGSDTDENRK